MSSHESPSNPADTVADAQPADPAPDIAELLQKAEAEAAGLKDAFLRAKAETDNARKQAQVDVARAHKYALERFAAELLPVHDALEQALEVKQATPEQLRDGVQLTLKRLSAAFDRFQITPIAADGEKFDPHRHQAMAMVEADAPPQSVVQVFQKGYLLNDRVLRPALVAVAKPREAAPGDAPAGAA